MNEKVESKEQAIAGAISRLLHSEEEINDIVMADTAITNIRVHLNQNNQGVWTAHASGKLTITLTS